MYIGQLGDGSDPKDGIYALLKGAFVMALDEFQMGYGKGFSIEVKENYAAVRDYGFPGNLKDGLQARKSRFSSQAECYSFGLCLP